MERFIGKDVQIKVKDDPYTIVGNLKEVTLWTNTEGEQLVAYIIPLQNDEARKEFGGSPGAAWIRVSDIKHIIEVKPTTK